MGNNDTNESDNIQITSDVNSGKAWMYHYSHYGIASFELRYHEDGKHMEVIWTCLHCSEQHKVLVPGCCFDLLKNIKDSAYE